MVFGRIYLITSQLHIFDLLDLDSDNFTPFVFLTGLELALQLTTSPLYK
jgi:hypothetical protein